MAFAFGLPALLVQRPVGGPISGLAFATAADLGILAIIAEDGGCGQYDPAIAGRLRDGARNVLRALGVVEGPVRDTPPPQVFERFVWVRTEAAGFFKAAVQVGDVVEAGAVLGTLGDFFGRTTETVTAPSAGRILFLVISPAMTRNGLICGIGVAG
jgi:predicted deacylase